MNYNDLSPFMLLDVPDRYHNALKKAKTEGLDCSDILNDTTLQYSWYSPHVLMLAYLVGDQTQEIHEENKQKSEKYNKGNETYWGALIKNGILEEKAIEILNLMIDCGADVKVKDFYERDIFDWSKESGYMSTNRKNNEKFKEEVRRLYHIKV